MYLVKRLFDAVVCGVSEPFVDLNRYVPKAFDGEFNVCFETKPLGIGLVPSTQLYGTWEVSSLAQGLQQLTPNVNASKRPSNKDTSNGDDENPAKSATARSNGTSKSPTRTTTTIRRASSSCVASPPSSWSNLRVDTSLTSASPARTMARARSRSFSSLSPPMQQQQQQQPNGSRSPCCAQCKSPCQGKCWQTIQMGDVIIAINGDPAKAHLSREELAIYLQRLSCPIVLTFRRPSRYGSSDSHSLVTAMYPTSCDYFGVSPSKFRLSRASSHQWKRGLQIELEKNRSLRKRRSQSMVLAERSDQRLAQEQDTPSQDDIDLQPDQEAPLSDSSQSKGDDSDEKPVDELEPVAAAEVIAAPNSAPVPEVVVDATGVATVIAAAAVAAAAASSKETETKISKMGEFDVTFNETPIQVEFAPSTRLYGTVEVYDPKNHRNVLEVGDVVMQVNDDRSVSRWPTEDLMDFLLQLQPPINVVFRRPTAYRRYVDTLFQSPKKLSSRSMARSMFPNTAEYRRASMRAAAAGDGVSVSNIAKHQFPVVSCLSPVGSAGDLRALPPLKELREFSCQLNKSDQFRLWSNPQTSQSSSILTVRHVRFLRDSLPSFLSCNEMNLAYSTRIHGWNLLSFYAQLEDKGPTVMVVKDNEDNVFGAFCPSAWHHSSTVFGNGRAFVFRLSPQLNAYYWSGFENSFMYTQRNCLFIGGGRKGIALAIQLDEARGFTRPCETFDSPPLSPLEEFQCNTIEVWAFTGLKV